MAQRFAIDGNFTQSFVGTVKLNASACGTSQDNLASLYYDLNNGSVCYTTSSQDFCYEYTFDTETIYNYGGKTGINCYVRPGRFQFGASATPIGRNTSPVTGVSYTKLLFFNSESVAGTDLYGYLTQNTTSGSITLSTTTQEVVFNYTSQYTFDDQIILGSDYLIDFDNNDSTLTNLVATSNYPFVNNERVCVSVSSQGGGGTATTYQTGSSMSPISLNNLKILDYDSNVYVTSDPITGQLTLQFGTRPEPNSLSVSAVGFNSDRFNKETDAYTVRFAYNLNTTTFISASLLDYNNSDALIATSTDGSSPTDFSITTASPYASGSHRYKVSMRVELADGTEENYTATNLDSFQLSKSDPGTPSATITNTPFGLKDVQLSGNYIKLHAGFSGSGLQFTTSSGAENGWEFYGGTQTASPVSVTNGTSETSNFISLTNNFRSPAGDNDPQLSTSKTKNYTQDRIFTFRTGTSTQSTISQTEALSRDFLNTNGFDIPLVSASPNENPVGVLFSIDGGSGEYHWFIFSDQYITTSTPVVKDVNNLDVTTVSQHAHYQNIIGSTGYRVFRAGPFGAGVLTYKFTNS